MTLTPEQLAALERIKGLLKKATPGPVGHDLNGVIAAIEPDGEWGESIAARPFGRHRCPVSIRECADLNLFAELRNAAPWMPQRRDKMPIKSDPDIMGGKPCIEGTRIPVSAVLRALAQYCQLGGIRTAYPHLRPEQAREALWFAADRLDAEVDDVASWYF